MPSCTTARRILAVPTNPYIPTISFDIVPHMPNHESLGSRRRLLVRQKGYQNLNVVTLDAIYPRSSHTRPPSFRRLRGIEEPPVLPASPVHQFGCPPACSTMSSSSSSSANNSLDHEEHQSNAIRASNTKQQQHKKDICMPSLSHSPSPRKLPVVPNLDDDPSIPGATWQRAPSYSYTRGLDTPPFLPPYRATATIKSKSTTKKSTNSRRNVMELTESVRRGYGFRSESTRSYCGSSLSSYETKRGRAAVRFEFQTPSMRSLSSYHYHNNRYTYSPSREDEEEERHSPRAQSYGDDIQEYQSYLLEEPDYYHEEEEEEVTYQGDHDMPHLTDSGESSRGVDTSSSSSSVGNMVDIGDGTQMRLRGADETWRAVENDFYAPGVCTCCQTTVFCIQDADYFICPGCRVISPLNEDPKNVVRGGGVGLGFTFEELSQWQQEMTNERSLVR